MPFFELKTNLPRDKIQADFFTKTTETLAKVLDKPMEAVSVTVIPDLIMSFGGSGDPCAIIQLLSIGPSLGEQRNITVSKAVSDLVAATLGLPNDKVKIRFDNPQSYEVGFKGTTVAELHKK